MRPGTARGPEQEDTSAVSAAGEGLGGKRSDRGFLVARRGRPQACAGVCEQVVNGDSEGVCAVANGACPRLGSTVQDVPKTLGGEADVAGDFPLQQVMHAHQMAKVRSDGALPRVLSHGVPGSLVGDLLTTSEFKASVDTP